MSGTQWFDPEAGQDQSQALLERVREAISRAEPLRIVGGGSKSFLGRPMDDALPVLDISGHRGIVSYDPTELILTARAGPPLSELHATLERARRMLACEPPASGGTATVGGLGAAGPPGPRPPRSRPARA